MPSPSSPSRNRSRSRSPDRRQRSSGSSRPRAPKQLDIYKRPAGGGRSGADPLDRLPPRGSTGGASDYRRSTASLADEGDYRSRADRRAGREDGGSGGRAGYHSGGGRDDDRRGGYGGDDRDRRTGGSDRYRDDDCRRGGDDRDSRGGGAYGRPQERDGPPPAASSSSSLARPTVGQISSSLSSSAAPPAAAPPMRAMGGTLIEIIANDRLGRKVRVKCSPQDTVGDLKKLIAAQSGTDHRKIQLKKSNHIFKNHITLYDYEINDGMSLELY